MNAARRHGSAREFVGGCARVGIISFASLMVYYCRPWWIFSFAARSLTDTLRASYWIMGEYGAVVFRLWFLAHLIRFLYRQSFHGGICGKLVGAPAADDVLV